ncbi:MULTISPECIES: hypothetical protein [unclassified Sphingobium]|uniref:hypothetical protein n=1 Tax=unclassified Sphingobium TaxID=2611147 RepID=UPI0005CC27B4|nr:MULTISPECIES: hypothetical protein [unclassified Sphingobium]AJR22501.1 hypothetical protein TZ53_00560 [Sphingobium sp. YBL2]UXC89488.1 hypothetical protein EGM87_10390 [Sphingobium sp. RSMS]
MTLVLAWQMIEGLAVVADTRFGSASRTVGEAGPKIFSVPIVLNKHGKFVETEKCRLPSMGFAFAGNVFAGQTANGLASTCLQNLLVVNDFDNGPTVSEVADLYARCAALVVNERRRWEKTDIHIFDGLVFGRSTPASPAQAFHISIEINEDAVAISKASEVAQVGSGALVCLGSGNAKVAEIVEKARETETDVMPTILDPLKILREVMDDPDVPSVAGFQQFAVATPSGVELRPGLRPIMSEMVNPFLEGGPSVLMQQRLEYQILGFDMGDIGNVGQYFTGATHFASG